MLIEMCCPVFKPISFTAFMLVVYLILFITEAVMGLNKAGELLEVNIETLIKLGANYPLKIRNG
jgi:hypothetical protein